MGGGVCWGGGSGAVTGVGGFEAGGVLGDNGWLWTEGGNDALPKSVISSC